MNSRVNVVYSLFNVQYSTVHLYNKLNNSVLMKFFKFFNNSKRLPHRMIVGGLFAALAFGVAAILQAAIDVRY